MLKTKGDRLLLLISLIFFLTSCRLLTEARELPKILGNYPLCEPSAVVKIPCPDRDGDCLLVGDNEINDTLFVYPLNAGELQAEQQQELSLETIEISDIEAIALLENDRVLIFGSHSRNGNCETKTKRQRWLQAEINNNTIRPINEVVQTPKIDSRILFKDVDLENNEIIQAVAKAIDNAEEVANLAKGNRDDCFATNHYNIEGAVAVNDNSVEPSIWLGMRSPLVTLDNKDLAILLHLQDINNYQFDRVTLLDLAGRGIRELTLWQNYLWGIAGGPEDGLDNFVLWRFPLELLQSNKIVQPEIVRSLPPSSEGLVFVDSTTAYILIDGNLGVSNDRCLVSGKFFKVIIP